MVTELTALLPRAARLCHDTRERTPSGWLSSEKGSAVNCEGANAVN